MKFLKISDILFVDFFVQMNISLFYITCKDFKEAETIGVYLVENKLAACVNILKNMKSIYRWKGKIESANEVVLLVKSKKSLFEKIEKTVKKMHSYECPCILSLSIENGNDEYLEWIEKETL